MKVGKNELKITVVKIVRRAFLNPQLSKPMVKL